MNDAVLAPLSVYVYHETVSDVNICIKIELFAWASVIMYKGWTDNCTSKVSLWINQFGTAWLFEKIKTFHFMTMINADDFYANVNYLWNMTNEITNLNQIITDIANLLIKK